MTNAIYRIFGGVALLVVSTWYLLSYHNDIPQAVISYGQTECRERRQVAYLKIPKCGSTTCMSICYRYGLSRNLTFALPYGPRLFFKPVAHTAINIIPPPPNKTYDMLCNHAVQYSKEAFSKVIPGATIITQIRSPLPHFISDFTYRSKKGTIKEMLHNPNELKLMNKISLYMGMSPDAKNNVSAIKDFILRADREFLLVMVLEHMEESVILLKRMMCWRLQDVLYFKLNSQSRAKPTMTSEERELHRKVAKADYMLYEYFESKILRLFKEQGPDFDNEVKHFSTIRKRVETFCKTSKTDATIVINKSLWNEQFTIDANACEFLSAGGAKLKRHVTRTQYPQD